MYHPKKRLYSWYPWPPSLGDATVPESLAMARLEHWCSFFPSGQTDPGNGYVTNKWDWPEKCDFTSRNWWMTIRKYQKYVFHLGLVANQKYVFHLMHSIHWPFHINYRTRHKWQVINQQCTILGFPNTVMRGPLIWGGPFNLTRPSHQNGSSEMHLITFMGSILGNFVHFGNPAGRKMGASELTCRFKSWSHVQGWT